MANATYSGPVDYAVFIVPAEAQLQNGFRLLLDQVDRGSLELLDLEIIGTTSGAVTRLPLSALHAAEEFDLAVLDGAESDILEPDDLAAIAEVLPPGHLAIVVVYEDRNLAGLASAWEAVGGSQLWSGGVDIDDLVHSLDTFNPKEN